MELRTEVARRGRRVVTLSGVVMGFDDVFHRRWEFTEDELLRLLWRCHAGESPDVVLVELYANQQPHRRRAPHSARDPQRLTTRLRRAHRRVRLSR